MEVKEKRTTSIEYTLIHSSNRTGLTVSIRNDEIEAVYLLNRPTLQDTWNELKIRSNQIDRLKELQEVIAEALNRLENNAS